MIDFDVRVLAPVREPLLDMVCFVLIDIAQMITPRLCISRMTTHDVRAIGKFGISGARLFAVSRGLVEIREIEPNDTPYKAQAVPLNVAINGTSDGNGDDFFRFPARKGERVTIDCQAFRLDSTMRASMALATADGRVLAQSKPYYARTDP